MREIIGNEQILKALKEAKVIDDKNIGIQELKIHLQMDEAPTIKIKYIPMEEEKENKNKKELRCAK